MRLHYLRGDVGAALAAFERCKEVLERTLGAPPSPETDRLVRQITAAGPAQALAVGSRAPVPVTLLRTPRLIGRQRELEALRDAWAAQCAALLLGEAGMGKSRLLAELAQAFKVDGGAARIVAVQGRPGDSGVPYATLARLLRRVRELGDYVLEPARTRELARILPELAPSVAMPFEGHRLVLQGAAEALLAKAELAAVLVDDLHFADEASIELLQAIIGSGALPTLRWALAQRPGEDNAAADRLQATLEEAQLMLIVPLGPLSEAEMRALVDSLGIAELDGATLAPTLVRRTGGNPLFALEVLKHGLATDDRTEHGQTPMPVNVGVLIERRLRQLSERALSLARVAAIAGVDFGIALAERVMVAKAVELADAWAELEAAQVFRNEAFAHDLVHEAALRTIPQAIAKHLHAACAEHLSAASGEPARIAAHWLASGGDEPASAALVEAAVRARRAGRLIEAARFELTAAAAFDRLGRADESFDRRFQAADDMSNVAPLDDYEPIAVSLEARAVGERQLGRAALAMAQVHVRRGAMDEGMQQLVVARKAAGATNDRRVEAEALFGQGVIHHWQNRFDPALLCLESAIAILDEIGKADRAAEMRQSLAALLRWLGRVREAQTAVEPATRYLLTINSPDQLGMCLRLLALLRLDTGDEPGAHEAMRQALLAAKEADFSESHWGSMVGDGMRFALASGDYPQALRIYEQARSDRRWAPSMHFVKVRTVAAEAMLDLGRHDLAGSILRETKSIADPACTPRPRRFSSCAPGCSRSRPSSARGRATRSSACREP